MRTAEQSELQQDNTHSLTASHSYANSIQQPGADILTPLASRSLFWRARYLEDSPTLCHIPLLFWLTEAARPRIAVTLGVTDAVPHFALCQAVDKLGMESLCIGVDETPTSPKTADFNAQHYAEFSHFLEGPAARPQNLPQNCEIDLIIVNKPASKRLIRTLCDEWLPRLSDRSSILFLHGPEAGAEDDFRDVFSGENKIFSLGLQGGVSILLNGDNHSERLQKLVRLQPGHPGFLAAHTVFTRLGELHSQTRELAQTKAALTQTRQNAALSSAELQKAQAQLKTQEDRDEMLHKLRTELNALRRQQSAGSFEETQHDNRLLHQEMATLQQQQSTLKAESEKLRKLTIEQENTLAERYKDIAVLGNELQTKATEAQKISEERDTLRQEVEALKRKLSEAEQLRDMHAERIRALEHSTSWRITAPLRKVSLAVKPQ